MSDNCPASDEFEISIFGPGFGEAIVAHIGGGNWLAIDCCIDITNGACVPLEYLSRLGVDVATQVLRVIATHWDDDHIRGLGEFFGRAKAARFCCASAFTSADFLTFALANSSVDPDVLQRATIEMSSVMRELRSRGVAPLFVGQDQILLTSPINPEVQAISLSPMPDRLQEFMAKVAERNRLLEDLTKGARRSEQTRMRASSFGRNDISVAMYLRLPNGPALLGADLEEVPKCGWTAILEGSQVRGDKASVFKVPHHGSVNGHCDRVWSDLLTINTVAVMTPWRLGGNSLPQPTDVQRILARTDEAYSTANPRSVSPVRRPSAISKNIDAMGIKLSMAQPRGGQVRLRRKICDATWTIKTFGTATHIRHL